MYFTRICVPTTFTLRVWIIRSTRCTDLQYCTLACSNTNNPSDPLALIAPSPSVGCRCVVERAQYEIHRLYVDLGRRQTEGTMSIPITVFIALHVGGACVCIRKKNHILLTSFPGAFKTNLYVLLAEVTSKRLPCTCAYLDVLVVSEMLHMILLHSPAAVVHCFTVLRWCSASQWCTDSASPQGA